MVWKEVSGSATKCGKKDQWTKAPNKVLLRKQHKGQGAKKEKEESVETNVRCIYRQKYSELPLKYKLGITRVLKPNA